MLNKAITSSLVLLTLLAGGLPSYAHAQKVLAQSEALQAAHADVTASVSQLDTEKEFAHRQEALIKVFDLTATEIKEIQSKDGVPASYIEDLSSYTNYVRLLKQQAQNPALTLEMVKKMAIDFKEWRTLTYEPRAKEAIDIALVAQSKNVLATTDARLTRISNDIKKLSASAAKEDVRSLSQLLSGAEKNIKLAHQYQNKAEKLLTERGSISRAPLEYKKINLKQGIGGVFTCLPGSGSLTQPCINVFRLANGTYYLVELSDKFNKTISLRGVYQGSGTVRATAPAYMEDATVAVVILDVINQVIIEEEVVEADIVETEKTLESSSVTSEMIQKEVKQVYSEVTEAYKKFFKMSKTAQKH